MAHFHMTWHIRPLPDCTLPNGFSIRTYQEGDEAGWFYCCTGSNLNTESWKPGDFQQKMLERAGICPASIFFVVNEQNQPVATATAISEKGYGYLHMVATHPDYRGRSLGKAVVIAAMQYMVNRGYERIVLETDDWREAAVHVYQSLGFTRDDLLYTPDSSELKVGIVGVRGLSTLLGFNSIPNVKVEALCDLDEELLEEKSKKHNIPHTYRVYEDMLASDINVVVVATPMQLHVQQVIQALEAGKHVLSEVTAGVTMDELWWLVEAAQKSDRVYMMAENYLYIPENQVLNNMVRKGLFGKSYFGEGEYLHELKDMQRYANGKTSWRKFWQLGTRGNFYPTHSLGPVMQWFPGDRVTSVSCFGTGWNTAPDLRQEDTTLTLCQLKSGGLIKLRTDCISERPHNLTYYSLQGTNGAYEAPRGLGDSHKIWLKGMEPNTKQAKWRPLSDFFDEYLPERYQNATPEQKAAGHWGGDFFIIEDFIQAIRNGTRPPVDVYDACEWSAVAILSALSVQNGGRTMDVPDFRNIRGRQDQILKF
ncbi:MAG: GNAT family N-acetyltransferase [Candidatus Merdivicinus sp.]|jgi:predicted dehydrogenase/ribosomal protein S18 acetylase RimI-like enzyme